MPFPEDLLSPIEGPNPSGASLRYDPLYDRIKEARREEDHPPPGMTERDRKVADNPLVVKLATDALKTKTKDLQLAAWLAEAWLKQKGFGGLADGLALCLALIDQFWDTLYPELEDGDAELRAAPLEFIGTTFGLPLKLVPLVAKETYSFVDYQDSRALGYEEAAKSDEAKKARAAALKEGKLAPEVFDKAFDDSPKAFYAKAEKDLEECAKLLTQLNETCNARFGSVAPSMGRLESALQEVSPVVHGFLQKKREKEPDPVEEAPAGAAAEGGSEAAGAPAGAGPVRVGVVISLEGSSEPADRLEAVHKVAEAAAFLRRREPKSPASYLMLRGLRWGELRAAAELSDPTQLEAPPTELRKHLKRLALDQKWLQLLEDAESAMALPCSRAWLDLQRFVVEACDALGSDYQAVARAIRSELRALVTDIPQLLDATLMDDTPAANADTRAWLKSITQEPPSPPPAPDAPAASAAALDGSAARWPGRAIDGYKLALQALREGQETRAFEILQKDLAGQRSGRERFQRRLQLVEMCVSSSKQSVAQPILDDLAAAIENHKLDDWEDPSFVAAALGTLLRLSVKVQNDKAQQQKLFERICRLDPAQALQTGK
ncbi:MAG TPA: type VI secretion system protein TssA [Terriglobia bacterium]|nr:type VI secretion system protein TssA [Terriglobia bacterium]